MKKQTHIFGIAAALLMMISGCTGKQNDTLQPYSMTSTNLGFDTVVTFRAYTKDEAQFHTYETIVKDEFQRYDRLFSKYDSYDGIANIKTINEAAGQHSVKVDAEIIELLEMAKHYDEVSHHQFSVTMGAVLDIWHEKREAALAHPDQAVLPTMQELKQANEATGWENVEIDKAGNRVYIKHKGTQLDVGAIAKGFAVEKIAKKLEAAGLQHAILNGGGNVRLIGNKPDASFWSVGLQIPDLDKLSSSSLVSIQVDDSASFVTSGDYQRYYKYKDQIMHHIIDPTTLMPAKHCRSVTVITKDGGIADLLSTALFTMSHADGVKLLKTVEEEIGATINAIWVYDDQVPPEDTHDVIEAEGYQLVMTDGAKAMIKK